MTVVPSPESIESQVVERNLTPISVMADEPEAVAAPRLPITPGAVLVEAEQAWNLAEQCFVWCDDRMTREALYQVIGLYEAAKGYALVGTSHSEHSPDPIGTGLSAAELRTRALELRYEVADLLGKTRIASSPAALQRMRRIAIAAACLALLATVAFRDRLGDFFGVGEVSLGARWVASSHYGFYRMNGILGHSEAPFFFHTEVEPSPSLEIDLRRTFEIRRAIIENRRECCIARAVPMVIETSQDHVNWMTVAKQPLPFETWRVDFGRRPVRWVRLRVLRRSTLHLSDVTLRI